jgi:hypothetical protein
MAEIDPRTGQAAAQAVRTAAPVSVTPGALEGMGASYAENKPTASNQVAGTKEKLTAIAQGGAAGLKNLQASQNFLQEQRQMALSRAAQRSAIVGGPEAQGFESFTEGEFARRSADIAAADKAASQAGGYRNQAIANYRKALQGGIASNFAFGKAKGEKEAAASTKEDFVAKALGQAELDEQTAAGNLSKGQQELDALNKERSTKDFHIQQTQSTIDSINERLKAIDKEWKAADSKSNAEKLMHGVGLTDKVRSKKEIQADQDRLRMQRHRVITNLNRQKAELTEWDRTKGEALKTRTSELDEQKTKFSPETRADRAREIAIRQMNVDPALATGKIGVEDVKSRLPKPGASDQAVLSKANVSMDQLLAAKQNPEYVENAELLSLGISSMSKEKALQLINTVTDPTVRAVLKAQYADEYLTAAQLKSASGKK